MLFLKAFSWETDLWVTLGDFTVKNENWEGKSVFKWKSIKLKRTVLRIITIICVTYVQKNLLIRTWIKQLLTKYQIFTKLPQIPRIRINRNFSSIFATFLDQLLHSYKFHGRNMSGILFFIFASWQQLKNVIIFTHSACSPMSVLFLLFDKFFLVTYVDCRHDIKCRKRVQKRKQTNKHSLRVFHILLCIFLLTMWRRNLPNHVLDKVR